MGQGTAIAVPKTKINHGRLSDREVRRRDMRRTRVLIINGSPNGESGNTGLLINAFAQGLEEAGASVEKLSVRDLKINPCLGCFGCWDKTPGFCVQKKDDMATVIQKMEEADILVLGSPVHLDGITGPLMTLLGRTLVRTKPYQLLNDEGHLYHPKRVPNSGPKKMVFIGNCGFWEGSNFGPVLAHMKAVAGHLYTEFSGALLRPHGPALGVFMNKIPSGPLNQRAVDVLDSAKQAGRELIETGKMSEKSLEGVSRELVSRTGYQMLANGHFGFAIAKLYVAKFVKSLKVSVGNEGKIPTPLVVR
ncbi:MAG: flavodoxin family protein [bacterium]